MFAGAPTMCVALLALLGIDTADLSSLKFANVGGAPLPPALNAKFKRLTGHYLNEGWGMTESSPAGTVTPVVGERRSGTSGLPMAGITISMQNPEASAEALMHGGFSRTGDVAITAPDGFVPIVDRTKDMMLFGGCNVYPRNVEVAIYEHFAVAKVAVTGIHDAYIGQAPKGGMDRSARVTACRTQAPASVRHRRSSERWPTSGRAKDARAFA